MGAGIFLMGRSDSSFSPGRRAGGHPYSHHIPAWCLPGLVDTPQTSSMGRRWCSGAKRNQTCPPRPIWRLGQEICGPLVEMPWGEMGGVRPGEAPGQQDSLLPVLTAGSSRRASGSRLSPLPRGQAVVRRGDEGRKTLLLWELGRLEQPRLPAAGTCCSVCPALVCSWGN